MAALLLFAYHEVPQAYTGFSPLELLYSRQGRGPLDILQEAWEVPGMPQARSIAEHALQKRDKTEEMTDLVQTNLEHVKSRQKTWYKRAARQ